MTSPIVPSMKRCSKCGEEKPATNEHWYYKAGKLQTPCSECCKRNRAEYRKNNSEKVKLQKRAFYEKNRDKILEYTRAWRECHRDHMSEKSKLYYRANRQRILNRNRLYHRRNAKRILDRKRSNPPVYRKTQNAVRMQNYKARKLALPNTLTKEQWQRALDYFNHSCAICGKPKGLWHTLAADHWIPLNSPNCLGTVVENIVPLCHGVGGCNNSKGDSIAEVWLIDRCGKRKAKPILERIRIYFEWVKQQ